MHVGMGFTRARRNGCDHLEGIWLMHVKMPAGGSGVSLVCTRVHVPSLLFNNNNNNILFNGAFQGTQGHFNNLTKNK